MTTDEKTTVLSEKEMLSEDVDSLVKTYANLDKIQNETDAYNTKLKPKITAIAIAVALVMAVICSVILAESDLNIVENILLTGLTFFFSIGFICDTLYNLYKKDTVGDKKSRGNSFRRALNELRIEIIEDETGMEVIESEFMDKDTQKVLLGKDNETSTCFIQWDSEKEFTIYQSTEIHK